MRQDMEEFLQQSARPSVTNIERVVSCDNPVGRSSVASPDPCPVESPVVHGHEQAQVGKSAVSSVLYPAVLPRVVFVVVEPRDL